MVQRYGEGITGGSESLARAVAERLCADYRITVFTSCARDYVTWRNELPEGHEPPGRRRGAPLPRPSASATSPRSTPSPNRCTRARRHGRRRRRVPAGVRWCASPAADGAGSTLAPTLSRSSCGSRARGAAARRGAASRAGSLRRHRLLHLPLLPDLLGPRGRAGDRRARCARAHHARRAAAALLGLP